MFFSSKRKKKNYIYVLAELAIKNNPNMYPIFPLILIFCVIKYKQYIHPLVLRVEDIGELTPP